MALREMTVQSTAGKGLSPKLWHKIDLGFGSYLSDWVVYQNDFLNMGDETAGLDGWATVVDTGGTINPLGTGTDATLGKIRITTDATDNDEVYMQSANGEGAICECSTSGGTSGRIFGFEARVAFTNITNGNAFIGLGEPGIVAADMMTDTGVMVDKDFIGFKQSEGDSNDLDFIWRVEGGAQQSIADISTALVADTFYTIGFVYEPDGDLDNDTGHIRIFLDNTEFATKVTSANLSASTFPAGELMSIVLGVKNGAAAIAGLDVDWVAFAQKKY